MIVKINNSLIDLAHCCEITPIFVCNPHRGLKINRYHFSIKLINQEPEMISIDSHWYKENGIENEKKMVEEMKSKRDELVKLWLQSRPIEATFNFGEEEE